MIMIAHRLNTIIDADLVVVMDKGRIEEQDHPLKLLTHDIDDPCITNGSMFADLVSEEVSLGTGAVECELKFLIGAGQGILF